jgi:hypothetical protein
MNMHSTASDLIVGATVFAQFIYRSDNDRFQRRVYYLTTAGRKRPLSHCRLGNRIAVRGSTVLTRIEEQEGRQ